MESATATAAACPAKGAPPGAVRVNERHAFHANVRVLPLDGRIAPGGGIVTDLSRDGVFVSAARPLPVDTLALLQIYSPQHHSRIRLLGRVVHGRDGDGFGCRFVDVDHVQRIVLDRFIKRIQGQAQSHKLSE